MVVTLVGWWLRFIGDEMMVISGSLMAHQWLKNCLFVV